jgi:hypothetical protein
MKNDLEIPLRTADKILEKHYKEIKIRYNKRR